MDYEKDWVMFYLLENLVEINGSQLAKMKKYIPRMSLVLWKLILLTKGTN